MKNLLNRSLSKITILSMVILFLISNTISFMNNQKAQSDFAKNTLSFISLYENSENLDELLGQFNKENKNSYLYTRDKSADELQFKLRGGLNKKITSKNPLSYIASYNLSNDSNLYLDIYYNLSYYLNYNLLLAFITVTFIILWLINKLVNDKVDQYIYDLEHNIDKIGLNNPYFDELRPIITNYRKEIYSLKNQSKALRSRLDEFITITSNMKEGFILFDGDGNIELLNDSAIKYLGVDKNANIKTLIDSKEYLLAFREASILKRSKDIDIQINGYFLRIFLDPLSSSSKKAFAMIIIDNTEDKRAEIMRREFSANVTHELKSPLTSINGYAELIATGIAKEDDVAKFGEIIYKEGNRLLEIIDDILKISRLDEKNYDSDFMSVDIHEVVATTIEKFDRMCEKKNIAVTDVTDSFRIQTSKSLFTDLVSNIYENAIKYNKVNGSINVSYELRDNCYYLIISDTGIGIAPADITRIFERFYVADKSRTRNQKSTGLGLSIVKHIAGHLGYEISVKSKLGEGTSFIIQIPLELDR